MADEDDDAAVEDRIAAWRKTRFTEEPDSRDVELLGQERQRQAQAARRNRVSGTIVGWVCAAALATLAYDSAFAARTARQDERSWYYPAFMAIVCALSFVCLVLWLVQRHRRH